MDEQDTLPEVQDPPSKKLYDGLVSEKLYTKTYDEFQKQFSTPEAISKLHIGLAGEGLYTKGADEFQKQFFPVSQKKNLPSIVLSDPSKIFSFQTKETKVPEWNPASLAEAHTHDQDTSKNISGNLWNRFLTGVGEMTAGVSDLVFQGLLKVLPNDHPGVTNEEALKKFREEGTPTIRTATKELAGAKVTPQQEKNFNDNFWTSALGGVAQTIPAMVGTKGTGFLFQAYDGGLQSINNSEKGKDLPESTKTIFGVGVGAAQAVIFKLGLDKIFGKQTSRVATNLAIKTFNNLVKTSKEPITAELFETALSAAAKGLKNKVLDAGGKLAHSAVTGALMGSAIEGSNILAEEITNKAQGTDIFEPTSWGEKFGRVIEAGASMAVGGAVLGAAALPFQKTRNYIAEKVAEAKTPDDIIKLKEELLNTAESKNLSPEEIEHLSSTIDDYVRVNQKVPEDVQNRKEVVEKIIEKEGVQQAIADKTQELQTLDDAFKPEVQKEIEVLNNKVEEINKDIINPKTENDASTQSQEQQQRSNEQSNIPEYARIEQAGSEGTLTSSKSSDSNQRSKGQEEKIEDILGVSKDDADILSILYNSDVLTPEEKKMLYRQYKSGVMNVYDIQKYAVINIDAIKTGKIDKWAQVILDKKGGDKSKIQAEDISFEEIIPEIKENVPHEKPGDNQSLPGSDTGVRENTTGAQSNVAQEEVKTQRSPEEIKKITRQKIDMEHIDTPVEIPFHEGKSTAFEARDVLRKRLKSIDNIIKCLT